jgi:uncharacterized protein YkwD
VRSLRGAFGRAASCLAVVTLASGLAGITTLVGEFASAPAAGAATYVGSAARLSLSHPIVDMAATPTGKGYWLAASDGGIFSYGDAMYHGGEGGVRLNKPIVGIAATPTGKGYWLVATDGGIFTFGDAHFYGSEGGVRLNKPIVGMTTTVSGHGYWLVASDGGIFTFGDAHFYGSEGGTPLNKPIVGMSATASHHGYWLVASDGGIFTHGDAHFYGSAGGVRLNAPIVGMAPVAVGGGYWLVGADGGIFNYGNTAHFYGSATGVLAGQRAVGIDASPTNDGYWVASQWGGVDTASPSGMKMDPNLVPQTNEARIANELINRINTERAARGLHPVYFDSYVNAFAVNWAHHLASTLTFQHQDLGTILAQSGGRLEEVGEDLFGGSGNGAESAGAAHLALMHSDGHRANILLPEESLVGVGAACMNGELIVVEDFATPAGVPLGSHPIPPLNPIAASNPGGAAC